MKPVAWLYKWDKGSDVWQHQLQGESLFDFVPNPHTCTPLYTADQLREAQVKVLREAADYLDLREIDPSSELRRMADELEKAT